MCERENKCLNNTKIYFRPHSFNQTAIAQSTCVHAFCYGSTNRILCKSVHISLMHHGVLCPVRAFNRSRLRTLGLGHSVSFDGELLWGNSNYGPASTKIQAGRQSTRLPVLLFVLFRFCQNVYKPNMSTVTKLDSSLHWSAFLYTEWRKSTTSYSQSLQHWYRFKGIYRFKYTT